jgi:hypothetical protein
VRHFGLSEAAADTIRRAHAEAKDDYRLKRCMAGQCPILHGQISFVTILRADYVPNAAICESPAWGSRGGSLRPAYRATSRPAGVRPAVAIANPKVAILVPAKMP